VRNFTNEYASIYRQSSEQDPTTYFEADTPESVVAGYMAQHKLLIDGVNADNQAVLEFAWDDGSIALGLQHPFSRGSVRLVSADPFDAPLADPAFLRNPLDLKFLVEAIKYTRQIVATSAFREFNPVYTHPPATITSDADLELYIREKVTTFFHPAGTCKAGPFTEGGVVNERFQVYGVDGLRVVDASVFPILPSTHTQASVYAVAEMVGHSLLPLSQYTG
jgi:choline dehydrogenase-like flavoprotein